MRFKSKEDGDSFYKEVNRIYEKCYPSQHSEIAGLNKEQEDSIKFMEKVLEIRRKEKIANILFESDTIPPIDIIKAKVDVSMLK